MRRSHFPFKTLLCLLVLAGVLYLTQSWYLPAVGRGLIRDEGPAKAEAAVVLAGDAYGKRILKGADLVRQGYVRQVLVSSPAGMYGHHEADLAIPFAVNHGYPLEWFAAIPHDALSTRQEAEAVLADLARRNIHNILLVTSDYHTGRAGRIFRAAGQKRGDSIAIRVVASQDEHFRPASWWREREAQKIVLMEYTKSVATMAGM